MAWDVDTLKEFILMELESIRAENDKRFAAQEKAVETAFNAAKEAVVKSEIGVEKRSDAVYVTITKLQDALAAVMPRAEAEQRFTTLTEKLSELSTSQSNTTSREDGSKLTKAAFYAGLGAVATVLGILVVIANALSE